MPRRSKRPAIPSSGSSAGRPGHRKVAGARRDLRPSTSGYDTIDVRVSDYMCKLDLDLRLLPPRSFATPDKEPHGVRADAIRGPLGPRPYFLSPGSPSEPHAAFSPGARRPPRLREESCRRALRWRQQVLPRGLFPGDRRVRRCRVMWDGEPSGHRTAASSLGSRVSWDDPGTPLRPPAPHGTRPSQLVDRAGCATARGQYFMGTTPVYMIASRFFRDDAGPRSSSAAGSDAYGATSGACMRLSAALRRAGVPESSWRGYQWACLPPGQGPGDGPVPWPAGASIWENGPPRRNRAPPTPVLRGPVINPRTEPGEREASSARSEPTRAHLAGHAREERRSDAARISPWRSWGIAGVLDLVTPEPPSGIRCCARKSRAVCSDRYPACASPSAAGAIGRSRR